MNGPVVLSDPCPGCGIVCRWVYIPAEGVSKDQELRIECPNPHCAGPKLAERLTPKVEPEAAA